MRQPHESSPEYENFPGRPFPEAEASQKAAPGYNYVQIIRSFKPGLQGMSPRLLQLFEQNRVVKSQNWGIFKKLETFLAKSKLNSNFYLSARKNQSSGFRLVVGAALLTGYFLVFGLSIAVAITTLTSMFPVLAEYNTALGLGLIFGLTMLNLESSRQPSGKLSEIWYFALTGLLALGSYALGYEGFLSSGLQVVIALGLLLMAFLAFRGFRHLINWLAYDKFMPEVFSSSPTPTNNYISAILLALVSSIFLVFANGKIENLLSPIVITIAGIFMLSQLCMITSSSKKKAKGAPVISRFGFWQRIICIVISLGLMGLALTFFLLSILPAIVFFLGFALAFKQMFGYYSQEYEQLPAHKSEKALNILSPTDKNRAEQSIIVLVSRLNKINLATLNYALTPGSNVTALFISQDLDEIEDVFDDWDKSTSRLRLIILENSLTSPLPPLLNYLEKVECNEPGQNFKVILPQIEANHWWERLLHNQCAILIEETLKFRKGVEVITVPFRPKHR